MGLGKNGGLCRECMNRRDPTAGQSKVSALPRRMRHRAEAWALPP
ncbi:hypothetical protein D554_3512 [Bordetella holmesii 30539]|uniref:Uncharacterized protein n=2 Tax=Bordetella holmesii TaxID=35814 RepID=A0A158M1D8_9BORD|nr:hypothetical protein D560_3616 [Bordetella holmesii ATCC 51541]EWM42716.1 hypothetical protein D556_3589 [Bordetella holmesii 41130]EXF88235.1 hypothetical protein D554_3512 [Bordetella holmesii 30539]EXX94237.1 hypothetical protein D559_1646 [Bordetella holmesii 1058]KAK70287.1 hypothetical protein L573_1378 [Bordetella holmesii H620]KAK77776.1 hypothetical protein L503_1386 [Bordetella holmesii CDC-H809-BH]KAK84165.1 hypothetical protein L496_1362 [Bordetella holmesii CDC-H572-BH]KAK893